MAAKAASKKQRLLTWLEERSVTVINEEVWEALKQHLAPASDSYLRRLVRETQLPLTPLVEGIVQDSFANLERTLLAMEREYEGAAIGRRKLCRAAVITAKDHLKWTIRRLPENDPQLSIKLEMQLWLMTWLENPTLFPAWLTLRKPQAEIIGSRLPER